MTSASSGSGVRMRIRIRLPTADWFEREHPVWADPGIDPLQLQKAPEHEAGADQQQEAERHLGDDNSVAEQTAAAEPRRAAAAAQHLDEIDAECAPRRH